MECHMLGIWHSSWYAEDAQQMVSDDDGDKMISSGVTNVPYEFS